MQSIIAVQKNETGKLLKPFSKTRKRKAVSTAKFYFFDMGIANILSGRKNIKPHTDLFGKSFEHFIFTELRSYLHYKRDHRPLSFWRDHQGHEVDFIIGDEIGIEMKGTKLANERHLKGLTLLSEEIPLKKKIILSMDQSPPPTQRCHDTALARIPKPTMARHRSIEDTVFSIKLYAQNVFELFILLGRLTCLITHPSQYNCLTASAPRGPLHI